MTLPRLSIEQMKAQAYCWRNQYCQGEAGYGLVEDFIWSQEDCFPVTNLSGTREEWLKWWSQELTSDGRQAYLNELFEWWSTNPDEHMFVVEGTDGKFYVWEGNHRTAVAKIAGMEFVPVILGTRKKKLDKFREL